MQDKLQNCQKKLRNAINKAHDEQVKDGMKVDLSVDIKDKNNGIEL